MKQPAVYIMASKTNGTLYIGADLKLKCNTLGVFEEKGTPQAPLGTHTPRLCLGKRARATGNTTASVPIWAKHADAEIPIRGNDKVS